MHPALENNDIVIAVVTKLPAINQARLMQVCGRFMTFYKQQNGLPPDHYYGGAKLSASKKLEIEALCEKHQFWPLNRSNIFNAAKAFESYKQAEKIRESALKTKERNQKSDLFNQANDLYAQAKPLFEDLVAKGESWAHLHLALISACYQPTVDNKSEAKIEKPRSVLKQMIEHLDLAIEFFGKDQSMAKYFNTELIYALSLYANQYTKATTNQNVLYQQERDKASEYANLHSKLQISLNTSIRAKK